MPLWIRWWTGTALGVLAALESYAAAAALGRETWARGLPAFVPFVLAAALQASWIGAGLRGSGPVLLIAGWIASCRLALAGWITLEAENAFWRALGLQVLLLLLVRSLRPAPPTAERLAAWRRARADIYVQATMPRGIVPWFRECCQHLLHGQSADPVLDHARLLATMTDADRTARRALFRRHP